MKFNLKYFLLMLLTVFVLFSGDVNAQTTVKADPGDTAVNVTETAGETKKNFGQKMKEAAQKALDKCKGAFEAASGWAKSQYETLMASKFVTDIKKNISEVQEQVGTIKESISAIKEAKDSAMAATNYKDLANETLSGVTSELTDLGDVGAALGDMPNPASGQLATLSAEFSELAQQLETRKNAVENELKGKHQAAKENLEKIIAVINTNNENNSENSEQEQVLKQKGDEYQAEYDRLDAELKEYQADPDAYLLKDQEYTDLKKQFDAKKDEVTRLAMDQQGLVKGALSKIGLTDKDRSAKYTKVLQDNFLGEKESETPASVTRVMKYRNKVIFNDAVYLFAISTKQKNNLKEASDRADAAADNIASADYAQTSDNMLIQARIEDAKILYNYTMMLIAGLRLETSTKMRSLPFQRSNYKKDPTVFQMDDYLYPEKKSTWQKIKDAGKTAVEKGTKLMNRAQNLGKKKK